MAAKTSSDALLAMVKDRRSIYVLNKDLTVPKQRIVDIVNELTLHTPTSFNSQMTRVLVLFGDEHDKLWDITTTVLKAVVPEDKWEPTGNKMNMFKGAAGTVLFFEDQDTLNQFQHNIPSYAPKFPTWATQADGMQQLLTWIALEQEGLGANLQHYDPLIDEKVAETWKLPSSWKLNAQLVFGGIVAPAGEKTFQPLEERVKVVGL